MIATSKLSTPVFFIHVPSPIELKLDFIYNYYVYDESTNAIAGIPEALKRKLLDQSITNTANFSIRTPRYVKLVWSIPTSLNQSLSTQNDFLIKDNLEKIATEDSFVSSRFTSRQFSSFDEIENAYRIINNNEIVETSQATIIDNYVSTLLNEYVETKDEDDPEKLRNYLTEAIENIEKIADRPFHTLGINFSNDLGQQIVDTSGFDQLVSNMPTSQVKIRTSVLSDILVSSSLSLDDINNINKFANYGNLPYDANEVVIQPVKIGEKVNVFNKDATTTLVGYIIEKYELTKEGFIKSKIIPIENISINNYIDVEVKYNTTYYYSIKTIGQISTSGYDINNQEIRDITYYISSKPISNKVLCIENTPPPPPVDINFIWDYNARKLKIVWGLPVNSQRDIKQFQVFRRKTINDPFELIRQKSFDYSTKKYMTGEIIDGNRSDISQDDASFIDYEKLPSMMYIDDDFIVDIELFSSSKFIYTTASIDAHGLISNYGSQFEITFDFFKNAIVKKFISNAGAPRQYPNLYLDTDLFKDAIKTDGEKSTKMKIYFMPEYFKLKYNNGNIQTMLGTKQQNAFYKMQFINLQNQKSDSLKITINDPHNLVK